MPPKTTSIAKKRSTGADQIEKAQADSTTSADGHPVYGEDKKWTPGDKVLCRYMHAENIYYEAKVTGLKQKDGEQAYSIHYPGWSSRHDEVVHHSQALLRFKDFTEEDAQKAKEEVKRAQQAITKKRKGGIRTDDSRSNTPSGEMLSAKRKSGVNRNKLIGLADDQERRKDLPQLVIPDPLRRILIDDENLINKSFFLPKLPARVTVFDIVQKYRESMGFKDVPQNELHIENADNSNALLNPTAENLQHSAIGILDYFECTLGTILLYKFERPMFNDMYEQWQKEKAEEAENGRESDQGNSSAISKPDMKRICYSKQFGLPHLLRMFVRFTDLLSYTEWSDRSLEAIIRHATDFVMFLSKNYEEFFNVDDDYVLASAEYSKRVWGNHA